MSGAEQLAQETINILAYFLPSFAVMLAVSWVVSLFRFDK